MFRNLAVLLCAGACFVLQGLPEARAAGSKKESLEDKEAKQSAKEDEAERNGSEIEQIRAKASFTGKVVLGTDGLDQPGPGVVGSLTLADGQVFQLKPADQALLKKLTPLDGRTAMLQGKLRNGGKYLVVYEVVPTPAPDSSAPRQFDRAGRGKI